MEDNPDTELCRYEFLELIVRMGLIKYWEKRLVNKPSEAVSK